MRAAALIILLPWLLTPQPKMSTGGLMNGRLWMSLQSPNSKSVFLLGYQDAVKTTLAGVDKPELGKAIFPWSLNLNENSAALDNFYREPTNRPVPIGRALMIIILKTTGASAEEIESQTAKARRDSGGE